MQTNHKTDLPLILHRVQHPKTAKNGGCNADCWNILEVQSCSDGCSHEQVDLQQSPAAFTWPARTLKRVLCVLRKAKVGTCKRICALIFNAAPNPDDQGCLLCIHTTEYMSRLRFTLHRQQHLINYWAQHRVMINTFSLWCKSLYLALMVKVCTGISLLMHRQDRRR